MGAQLSSSIIEKNSNNSNGVNTSEPMNHYSSLTRGRSRTRNRHVSFSSENTEYYPETLSEPSRTQTVKQHPLHKVSATIYPKSPVPPRHATEKPTVYPAKIPYTPTSDSSRKPVQAYIPHNKQLDQTQQSASSAGPQERRSRYDTVDRSRSKKQLNDKKAQEINNNVKYNRSRSASPGRNSKRVFLRGSVGSLSSTEIENIKNAIRSAKRSASASRKYVKPLL